MCRRVRQLTNNININIIIVTTTIPTITTPTTTSRVVLGLEEFDNQESRRLPSSPQQDKGEEEDEGLDEGGRLETMGDVVLHMGAAGSRRKLLNWKVE